MNGFLVSISFQKSFDKEIDNFYAIWKAMEIIDNVERCPFLQIAIKRWNWSNESRCQVNNERLEITTEKRMNCNALNFSTFIVCCNKVIYSKCSWSSAHICGAFWIVRFDCSHSHARIQYKHLDSGHYFMNIWNSPSGNPLNHSHYCVWIINWKKKFPSNMRNSECSNTFMVTVPDRLSTHTITWNVNTFTNIYPTQLSDTLIYEQRIMLTYIWLLWERENEQKKKKKQKIKRRSRLY